jgi:hypothetical protein
MLKNEQAGVLESLKLNLDGTNTSLEPTHHNVQVKTVPARSAFQDFGFGGRIIPLTSVA